MLLKAHASRVVILMESGSCVEEDGDLAYAHEKVETEARGRDDDGHIIRLPSTHCAPVPSRYYYLLTYRKVRLL